MNIKKILVLVACIALLVFSFFGGYKYNQSINDNSYKKATKPADNLIMNAVSDNPDSDELKKLYEDTHQSYKDSTPLDQYNNAIKSIKNSKINETDAYIGSSDNLITYSIESKMDNKKYSVYIGTAKDDKLEWKVSSIIVSEQQ